VKKLFVIALISVFGLSTVHAQKQIKKDKSYKTWVSLDSKPFKSEGILYEVKDLPDQPGSIVIQKNSKENFDRMNFDIKDIQTIKARRTNSVGKGILIGAISGFVIGGVSGLAFANGGTGGETAMSVGMPMALVGSGMGAIAGSAKITIPIFGSRANYKKNETQLKELALK